MNFYPLRMLYLPCDTLSSNQVLFSVPKKRFKQAVTRNKLKRRMREAYRLQKHLLNPQQNVYFLLGYIYIAPHQAYSFDKIQKKIAASFQCINHSYASDNYDPKT